MRRAIELSNVHNIVLVLQDRSLVVVDVKVVGCAEDCHDARKASRPRLSVHAITGILRFVGSDDGEEIVLLEEVAGGRIREEVGATSDVVVNIELASLLLSKFFQWIGPENVAHQAVGGRLSEPINALNVLQCMQLGAQATVYAQELLVHDSSKWQRTERFHACVVNLFRILVLALQLEGEVVSKMTAFVVASEEPEGVRVPDLERPEIQDALDCQPGPEYAGCTHLNTEITSINVVSEKEVPCL